MLIRREKQLFSAERKMLESKGTHHPEGNQSFAGQVSSTEMSEVLAAIKELKGMVAGVSKKTEAIADLPEISVLRDQLEDLRTHIFDTKKEIASIRHPGASDDRLTTAALELDAIVDTTEKATHRILNATEEIGELLEKLKERSQDVGATELIDEANAKTIDIMEACNFQDISGQRTTKVIKTINYLEERILSMIEIWGVEEFREIEIVKDDHDEEANLMQGPQHEGAGINQDDIDALFD